MAEVRLIRLDECRPGAGTFVPHGDLELAVFRLPDPERIIVIDNACPHASGNLAGGSVEDGIVTCPWHQWEFDLNTGVCTHSPAARVMRYPARVENGMVIVDLPD